MKLSSVTSTFKKIGFQNAKRRLFSNKRRSRDVHGRYCGKGNVTASMIIIKNNQENY